MYSTASASSAYSTVPAPCATPPETTESSASRPLPPTDASSSGRSTRASVAASSVNIRSGGCSTPSMPRSLPFCNRKAHASNASWSPLASPVAKPGVRARKQSLYLRA
eukprot:3513562-Prymnesium_polylepis.1